MRLEIAFRDQDLEAARLACKELGDLLHPHTHREQVGRFGRDLPACHEDWSSPSDRRVPVDAVPQPGRARSQRAATADPMPGPAWPLLAQSRCSQEFGGVTDLRPIS